MTTSPWVPPPAARPIAIIGDTAVKVTPCSRGSLTPTFQKPIDWMIDAMPQVKRSALIRCTSCWSVRPMAPASRIGTMTAPA